jgi:hypothetical protein
LADYTALRASQPGGITETIRDQNGNQLSSRTLTLPALNHTAFNPTFPSGMTGGGVVEYDAVNYRRHLLP